MIKLCGNKSSEGKLIREVRFKHKGLSNFINEAD